MANSARKNVSKKPKVAPLIDEKQQRHDRLTLVLYLLAGLALIAGMVVLSEFLSQGEPTRLALIIAGSLFGVCAVGFLVAYLLRRSSDKK